MARASKTVGVFHCRKDWDCEGLAEEKSKEMEGHFGMGFLAIGRVDYDSVPMAKEQRGCTSITFVKA